MPYIGGDSALPEVLNDAMSGIPADVAGLWCHD
jgi:hypothetical protein